jgi:hypothetical protein
MRLARRCRRIFARRYFRCRQCHGLIYVSRNESPTQHAIQRADKIANLLHDMCKSATKTKWKFPPKLHWTRWKTYRRLGQPLDELQRRWMDL